jgi:hypothetical protein
MDKQVSLVRAPKGTGRKVVPIMEVKVPDMWHLAMALQDEGRKEESEKLLDCWWLCIELLQAMRGDPDYTC